jgi:three-Cys-motif partner protein
MPKDNKKFFEIKNHWSEIKDQLLGCYLVPYFQKLLMTKQPILYIDCFAGKGKFDDGNPGSPIIALEARDTCLKNTLATNGKIDSCFIDLNYATELVQNLAPFKNANGTPNIVPGKYEEQIAGILSASQKANVFLYIDPYGIKALDAELFDSFKSYGFRSFEMLINFNSFGFFRDACRVMKVSYENDEALRDLDDLVEYDPTEIGDIRQPEDLLNHVAGGDYWKDIVNDYNAGKINGYQAEQRLSTCYKQRLRTQYGYVLDMPIRLKSGHRPKYRMIHVCNHEDGCFLMAQNMQKRKDELFIQVQQAGQLTLFDLDPSLTSTIENEIVTSEQIKKKLLEHISRFTGDVGITAFLATFVNDYGLLCEFRMIYTSLDEIESDGQIKIIRDPALTMNGKPRTFWEENKKQSVTIRRLQA